MTMNMKLATPKLDEGTPVSKFSECHKGIVSHLHTLGELPALLEPAARARSIAEETLRFFPQAVFDHHTEEEKDLFPAVLAAATQGGEREKVRSMIQALTAEHRAIEALWTGLEQQLKKLAMGQKADIARSAVEQLVRRYTEHARFEEAQFLPLSEEILGRQSTQMAALGLSLHMRDVFRDWRRNGLLGS
jgi:hemerythrin-like domain-containing protein